MDPAAAKASNAPKTAAGERRPSGSSTQRGSLIPPTAELGRRPSLLLGDGENRKLRPGEVLAEKKSTNAKALEGQINGEPTPLRDIGEVGPPQFVDMYECYSAVEGEVGYISAQVQGIPAPTFKFYYKGVTPLIEGVRYKYHTDGETNTVTLCMRNIKSSDEGKYKIVFTNSHGTVSDETQLYVSKPGVTDFRTLLRKSKYAKWGKDKGDPKWGDLKGVQKAQDQFTSPLQDQTVKEGKDKKVEFVAKFTKQNAKSKWYFRKNELFMGVKYKFRNDGNTYQLTVLNPKLGDSGPYMIDIGGVQSSALLTVDVPDPTYSFVQLLQKKYNGYTKHELILECKVSDSIAIVSWYKGENKLSSDNKYFIDKDLAGVCTLKIKSCDLDDTGDFRCQLERQTEKTVTSVKVVEYQYKFAKLLKSQQNIEKDTVTLACELDDPLGEVKWFKGSKEIKPDGDRIQVVKDGRKRKLVIKDAKLTDADQYSCTSNADKTAADLIIKKQNKFNKELKDTVGVEREKLVFDIELEDDTAPAEWKLNGKSIKSGKHIEIKNLGGGKHQLVINDLKIADAGEITVESGKLKSSCKLTVEKGETKPQISALKEIEGTVGKPLVFEVPYKIDGKKQTPIAALLLKDGKPLPSNDVEVQVKDDKVIFTIKKPATNQSGPYQIKLSNGQGDDVKDVKITVQDVPNAPQDVIVREVFEKSCIIDWKSPKENGGTPIQKYVIERHDVSSKDKWDTVGEVPADKPTTFKVEDLTPNKQYKFRIRAINKVGPSQPAEFKNVVLAKNPWAEASKPKNVEVVDWVKNLAKIKWLKPEKDGGAEITEYEIEIKDKGSKEWVKKKRVPASETTATIDDLKEGQECEFRVRAVNKAGLGEPSDAIKKPWVEASKPKNIEVVDWVKNLAKIKWLKPDKDGGAEITEYEIEMKDKGSKEWVKKKRVPASETTAAIDDLKEGQECEFRVRAVTKAGLGEPSDAIKKPWVEASKPKNVEVVDWVKNLAKIKWLKPEKDGGAEITEYEIEIKDKDSKDWVKKKRVPASETTAAIDDLKEGQECEFRVRAVTKAGLGEPSDAIKKPWVEASKPKNVEVVDWVKNLAKIKWLKPEKDGGAEITEYEIEIKDKGSKEWVKKKRVPSSETTATIDDLKEGQECEFRVRAVTKAGLGEPSDAIKKPWVEASKPKNVEVVDWVKNLAKIKWLKPEKDGGAEITEYEIEIKDKDSKDWVKKKRVPASETTATIDDLKEGQECEFRVRAVTKAGLGEPSDAIKKPWVEASKPKNVEVVDWVKNLAKIKWLKPEKDGGAEITEYEIEMKDKGSKEWVKKKRVPASETTATIDDLKEGQECEFRVRAVTKAGLGEPSDAIKKPWVEASKPKNVEVVDWVKNLAKIKWLKPEKDGGAEITEYEIEIKDKDSKDWVKKKRVPASETTATIDDLKEGQECELRVRAVTKAGPGEPSDAIKKPWVEASKPKNVEVVEWDKTHAKIKWLKPEKDGGAQVTEYEIEIKDKDSKDWVKKKRVPASETTATIDDLKEGQECELRVRAVTKAGPGEPSDAIKKPWVEASKPKNVEVVEWDKTHAKIKWLKPEKDGGAEVTEYEIEIKDKDSKDWIKKKRVPASETIATIDDLKEGQECELRVRAVTKAGPGEPSDAIKKPWVEASKPKNVEVVEWDKTHAKIKWLKPEKDGGAQVTEYEIEIKDKDSKDWVKKKRVPASETTATIDDLKEGQECELRVRAVTKAGPGEPSDAIKKPWVEASKPKNVEVVEWDKTHAKIKWLKPEKDGGAEVTEYEIEIKDKDSKDWIKKKRVPASETIATIDDLKEGQECELRVRAVTKAGPGEPSDAIKKPWVEASKPKNVEVVEWDKTHAKIKWLKPEKDGGAQVTEYEIEIKDKDSKDWVKKKRVPASETTATIDDLKEGQECELRVRAVTKAGPGEPSDAIKKPWVEASKPKNVEVVEWDKTHVKIKWLKPEKDGGAEVTEYEIEIKDKDSKDWVKKKRVPASETTATIDDLKEGQECELRVRAVTKAGPGEPSDAIKKPWVEASKPKNVEVVEWDKTHAKIKWLKPEKDGGAQVTEYEIEIKDKDSKDWVKKKRVPASETTATIDDLKEGQECELRVRAVTKAGPGEPSDAIKKPWVEASKPKNVEVVEWDKTHANIKWLKPEKDGGAEVTEYEIEIKDKDSKEWVKKKRVPASETTATIDDLKEGQECELRVRAITKAGPGEPSEAIKKPWVEASKPKNVEVVDWDKDYAKIKWSKPDKDGGAEITAYEIEVKDKKSKQWVKKKRVAASESTTTIEELTEGEEYEFRVRAVTKAGPGEPSDATKPIVAKCRSVKPFITGDQLKNITIKKGQQIRYEIRYGGEPEPKVKWTRHTMVDASEERIKIEKSGGTTIITVQNAVRGDSGTYKVILTNSSGTIESTGEVIVLDKPSAPKGPIVVTDVNEEGCKLKWNKPDDDGGVLIKQYKIEKLDSKTNKWSLVTKVAVDKTEYTVTGLTKDAEYKFRLTAINDEGESEALVTERWTITKRTETEVVEYKTDAGVEVGVETCTTKKNELSGDLEHSFKTTVTTTTMKNQVQDGYITRTITTKRVVTRTEEEEEYEEFEDEEEEEEEHII